jgi:hypothetical protein
LAISHTSSGGLNNSVHDFEPFSSGLVFDDDTGNPKKLRKFAERFLGKLSVSVSPQ